MSFCNVLKETIHPKPYKINLALKEENCSHLVYDSEIILKLIKKPHDYGFLRQTVTTDEK